ncbi:HNH endonuclease [Sinomicrobium kalidii]|uniref:HNH endonuclease n=1 Tax=Sinomicrobium kalidii TaxID=2900738 RepID=UPI001E3373AA|nr:HNH endonuclease [Sinomicrobium kalidii]UGU17954.1 HNH endonuclease [Sinomicrobium kalidii]
MTKNKNWTYEEHILAFNLYCKIPFTKINANYAPVKELAGIIGRTNGAMAMKLANFARLDPALQARNVSGLTQGAKGEEEVWNEFHGNWEELAWQSEQILARYKGIPVEKSSEISIDNIPEGKEREATVKNRVNQSFFRKMILASYNYSCCITGISVPELLVASHIIPWSEDKFNRMNPSNGLCLNSLHDSAFDKGLLTITPDYKIKLSQKLLNITDNTASGFFLLYNNKSILPSTRFSPDLEFLEWHNKNIFKEPF